MLVKSTADSSIVLGETMEMEQAIILDQAIADSSIGLGVTMEK